MTRLPDHANAVRGTAHAVASATYTTRVGRSDHRPRAVEPGLVARSSHHASAMRLLGLVVLVAACGTDAGARLTLRAPDGPSSATSYQIVLASPALIPVIPNQRVDPTSGATETVTYYLQRTTAGAGPARGAVSGFTLRIEPNATVADTAFIPFVLIYGASSQLIGVATYHAAGSGAPAAIVIRRGEIDEYTLDVEPVTEVDAMAAVAAGQAQQITCISPDQMMFSSGIVWRPANGGELRLMLPDQPDSSDATQRALDLDCDGHAVAADDTSADCDDTRPQWYRGAPETCSMFDANCDGVPYVVTDCTTTVVGCTGPGISICDEATGTVGACEAPPQCLCANGSGGCTKCLISHDPVLTAGSITPCQPGIGALSTQGACAGGACTVEVVSVSGGWNAAVAATSQEPFGPIALAVTDSFLIRASRPEGVGAAIAGQPGHTTGEVDLDVIDASGGSHIVGVELVLDVDSGEMCAGNGPYPMACSP